VIINRATAVYVNLDTSAAGGEVINIQGSAPVIDSSSTSQGVTLDADFTQNVPVPSRTFESALGAAAGSQDDSWGVSFSGSTSLENNTYVIDGINTTGLALGTASDDPWDRDVPARRRRSRTRSSKGTYTGNMLKVMKRVERGDLDAAIAKALRWRANAPGDVMAVIALGEALEAAGYYALAARAYGSIADLYPSRAEMTRYAAARLLRFGSHAAKLATDLAQKAVDNRPDHPSGHRLLAFSKLMAGDRAGAFDAIERALEKAHSGDDPRGRFAMARDLFESDLGTLAAAWLAAEPGERRLIRRRLSRHSVLVPMEASMSVVLSWETDANDVDLYVNDGARRFQKRFTKDGSLLRDVSDGFGPEAFVFRRIDPRQRYRVWAHYANQDMMGYGFGYAQILAHDGAGELRIDTRPFAVMTSGAHIDLGEISAAAYREKGKLGARASR